MDYIVQPKDYWIAPNAVNITLNALGNPNRIQCSVASGAAILCYIEGVKGLGYDNGHRFKTWPLTISPTYFNSNTEKYVYVAIPRSASVGTQAVVVFPSEKLDIYGVNANDEQVGSTDYYYIWLQGILTATDGTSNREWQQAIDFGKKGTDEDLYDDTTSDWYQYSKVSGLVTFLKNIAMNADTTFHNLILGYKELTGVATSYIAYTDSDMLVATPGYVESQYLSKTHESEAQEQVGFLKGLWIGVRSLYEITANGIAKLKSVIAEDVNAQRVQTGEIKSPNYTGDGVADTGFRLTSSHNGHSKLTIDEIYVRMKAVFESLEVRERTYTGGDQIWSCAGNRIIRVDYLGNAETADHVPQMVNVHADGRPEGTGEGDVYSVPVPGDTYGYSDVKVPWLLRQMPLLARAKVFARYRKVRIVINEPASSSANRAAASESPLANIRRARCYFLAKDDDMEVHNWWRINDLARCQTMNLANTTRQTYISGEDQKAGNIFWWRKVIGVSYEPVTLDDGKEYHYFDVSFDYEYEQEHPEVMVTSVMEGSDIPAAQDSVVQFGNTIIEGRMNLMMMEVNGSDAVGYNPTTDAPCLKAYRGVYCFDLNKSWVGGHTCKMKLSPKSGYEFYGPNFKIVTEYDVVPVPVDRGLWLNITPTRDDYREHAMVRKCYYYDKVSHNGSYWLCSIVDGAHWVDGSGDYISDAAYSALTEEQKALCSRKQNYTIEEPSANSIDWTEVIQKGDKGSFKSRVFCRTNSAPDTPQSNTPTGTTYNTYDNPVPPPVTGQPTWTDGIPQGTAILWSSVCTFYADGTNSGWSTPSPETDTETLDIEFSPNDTQPDDPVGTAANKDTEETINARQEQGWYDPSRLPADQQMIWRAERKIKNGVYNGDWVVTRIYGESGDAAPYYVEDYGIGASRTSHSDISSWSSSQPSPTTQKPYVWKRTRLYNPNTQTYGDATYVCLTGERGVNGKDGWMITANPANVIITQALGNDTTQFSTVKVGFTAKKGSAPATVSSLAIPTGLQALSNEFNAAIGTGDDSKKVIVSSPKTYTPQGGTAQYYTEGTFVVDVIVTDPDTGNSVAFNVTVPCYANLLGTWKREVEGGVETVVAELTQYLEDDDGNIITSKSLRNDINDATKDLSELSKTVTSQGQVIQNQNTRLSTAEGNISTVQRNAVTRNLLGRGEWTLNATYNPYADYDAPNDRWYDKDGVVNDIYSQVVSLKAGKYCFYGYIPITSSFSNTNIALQKGATTSQPWGTASIQPSYLGEVSNDAITINSRTYHRCYAVFTLDEDSNCSINLWSSADESDIAVPCLCEGEAPNIETSMSMIRQTADSIEASVKKTMDSVNIFNGLKDGRGWTYGVFNADDIYFGTRTNVVQEVAPITEIISPLLLLDKGKHVISFYATEHKTSRNYNITIKDESSTTLFTATTADGTLIETDDAYGAITNKRRYYFVFELSAAKNVKAVFGQSFTETLVSEMYVYCPMLNKGEYLSDFSIGQTTNESYAKMTADEIDLSVKNDYESAGLKIVSSGLQLRGGKVDFTGSDGVSYIKVSVDANRMPHFIFMAQDGVTEMYDLGYTGLTQLVNNSMPDRYDAAMLLASLVGGDYSPYISGGDEGADSINPKSLYYMEDSNNSDSLHEYPAWFFSEGYTINGQGTKIWTHGGTHDRSYVKTRDYTDTLDNGWYFIFSEHNQNTGIIKFRVIHTVNGKIGAECTAYAEHWNNGSQVRPGDITDWKYRCWIVSNSATIATGYTAENGVDSGNFYYMDLSPLQDLL